jgi:hypothetical protein
MRISQGALPESIKSTVATTKDYVMVFVPLYRGMKCAEGKFLLPSPRPFKVIFKILL